MYRPQFHTMYSSRTSTVLVLKVSEKTDDWGTSNAKENVSSDKLSDKNEFRKITRWTHGPNNVNLSGQSTRAISVTSDIILRKVHIFVRELWISLTLKNPSQTIHFPESYCNGRWNSLVMGDSCWGATRSNCQAIWVALVYINASLYKLAFIGKLRARCCSPWSSPWSRSTSGGRNRLDDRGLADDVDNDAAGNVVPVVSFSGSWCLWQRSEKHKIFRKSCFFFLFRNVKQESVRVNILHWQSISCETWIHGPSPSGLSSNQAVNSPPVKASYFALFKAAARLPAKVSIMVAKLMEGVKSKRTQNQL